MAFVMDERTGQKVADNLPGWSAAEDWIAEREKIDPEGVHAGHYTVDGSPEEYAAWEAGPRLAPRKEG